MTDNGKIKICIWWYVYKLKNFNFTILYNPIFLIKFGKTIIMTFKVILPVEDNKVVITLPPDFSGRKNVLVYVDDEINQKTLKIEVEST